jgi:hypothetical protein
LEEYVNRPSIALLRAILPVLLALGSAGCPGEDKGYECQVLCQYPSGEVLGSDTTITITAASSDDATDKCPDNTDYRTACEDGGIADGCSCDSAGS